MILVSVSKLAVKVLLYFDDWKRMERLGIKLCSCSLSHSFRHFSRTVCIPRISWGQCIFPTVLRQLTHRPPSFCSESTTRGERERERERELPLSPSHSPQLPWSNVPSPTSTVVQEAGVGGPNTEGCWFGTNFGKSEPNSVRRSLTNDNKQ